MTVILVLVCAVLLVLAMCAAIECLSRGDLLGFLFTESAVEGLGKLIGNLFQSLFDS